MKVYLCDQCKKPKGLTLWEASQKQVIKQALAESQGKISIAAVLLGIALPTARRYARMYKLSYGKRTRIRNRRSNTQNASHDQATYDNRRNKRTQPQA